MSPRRPRLRPLDLVVTAVCVACLVVPLAAVSQAEERSQVEQGGNVDQKVAESGMISNPLNGSFAAGGSGVVNGQIQWDIYTTSPQGMKLTVSADRTPALRDAANSIDIPDYSTDPKAWDVASGARSFGFTVQGDIALGRYDGGDKWRGFTGGTSVEVARKKAALPATRTTVKLRAEFGAALPSGARPTANLVGTAVVNL
jgi:hypothetical protein